MRFQWLQTSCKRVFVFSSIQFHCSIRFSLTSRTRYYSCVSCSYGCVSAFIVVWQIALGFATFLFQPVRKTRQQCAKYTSFLSVHAKCCVFCFCYMYDQRRCPTLPLPSSSLNLCMQITSWLFDLTKTKNKHHNLFFFCCCISIMLLNHIFRIQTLWFICRYLPLNGCELWNEEIHVQNGNGVRNTRTYTHRQTKRFAHQLNQFWYHQVSGQIWAFKWYVNISNPNE